MGTPNNHEKTIQVSLSLWESIIVRIEDLIGPMTDDMRSHGGDASRSSVLRSCIYEGIKVLEARYRPSGTIGEDTHEVDEDT